MEFLYNLVYEVLDIVLYMIISINFKQQIKIPLKSLLPREHKHKITNVIFYNTIYRQKFQL